jgi:hypothetical protein
MCSTVGAPYFAPMVLCAWQAGDVVRHSLAYIDRSPDRQTNVSLVLYMLNLG